MVYKGGGGGGTRWLNGIKKGDIVHAKNSSPLYAKTIVQRIKGIEQATTGSKWIAGQA